MAQGVFNANRLLQELRAQGYTGGKTILKEFLRPHRPPRVPRTVVRFEPAAGAQAQVDWGEFPYTDPQGRRRKVYGFVMVLSYSRAMYVEFVEQQDLSTLLRCHLHAFAALGGCSEGDPLRQHEDRRPSPPWGGSGLSPKDA